MTGQQVKLHPRIDYYSNPLTGDQVIEYLVSGNQVDSDAYFQTISNHYLFISQLRPYFLLLFHSRSSN